MVKCKPGPDLCWCCNALANWRNIWPKLRRILERTYLPVLTSNAILFAIWTVNFTQLLCMKPESRMYINIWPASQLQLRSNIIWVVFLTVTWNTISITRVSFRTPFSNKRRKLNNKISWPFWSAWFQYRKIWIISAIDHTFYGFTGVVLRRVIFKLFECWQRSPNMLRGLSWRR